jgi:signal transduction histidine kinase
MSAKSLLRSCGIAFLFVGGACVITIAIQGAFPYPFLFLLFGAVLCSGWFGHTAGGLFSVLLSTLVAEYFFVPPLHSFGVNRPAETYFGAFVVCALAASWVSSAMKKSEDALRQARDQLEVRVSERTAALMKTQVELAHLSRVLSMGELTASIAHEINQPLAAIVTHGHACLEWLSAQPPNLEKARLTTERIIQDGTRAGGVLSRIRAVFKKEAPAKSWLDMNEVINELTVFLREEAVRRQIVIRADLSSDLPMIKADRIQLQQVVLNLVINGMEAISEGPTGPRELLIRSRQEKPEEIVVEIEDCGEGFDAASAERIFDPFYTTKPQGIGMGLSISRSIVESHRGRLWATSRASGGAIFHFTLPVEAEADDD